MAELEKAGIPTVALVATDFVKDWGHSAPAFGVKELASAIIPRPFVGMQAEDIRPKVDKVFDDVVALLKSGPKPAHVEEHASDEPELIAVEGEDAYLAFENMNRMFLAEGWGDGFPLWAPTRERVDRMLKGTRRPPGDVVAKLDPGKALATVEKIAINGVMAGCAPEALPVLIAAVEAISDPAYMMRNVSMSTGAHTPFMLLNGPIAKRLGVHSGRCALGPGVQSAVNTALGRAMRLIYMNVGHAYPCITDMDTLGSPTKYSLCLAENEEISPWAPYHVDKGFDKDESVVTMFSTYALSEVEDGTGTTPEQILNIACTTARNQGVKAIGHWLLGRRTDPDAGVVAQDTQHLIVCPVHAAIFSKYGWSKQDISNYLFKHARIPFGRFMANKQAASFDASHADWNWLWDSPDTLMPVLESADCFEVFVAGGMGGARSTYSYGAAEPVSRRIEE